MNNKTGICIVGAGVIGLSIANELLNRGYSDITILDKEASIGLHASGRNSGVLHAGIYYSADSLKAKFCLEGNRTWHRFCDEHKLPLLRSKKVLVCRSNDEIPTLNSLYKQAQENGAKVELIDESGLAEVEPLAKTCEQALLSHETSVVDPKAILEVLRQRLENSGKVQFLVNTHVHGIGENGQLLTKNGRLNYDYLFNASGSSSDKLAHEFGLGTQYRLIPFKGAYKQLSAKKSSLIQGNIYPVPDLRNPFLGVHFTKSVKGTVYAGPTAIPAFGPENYGFFDGLTKEFFSILMQDLVLFFSNPKFRRLALTEPKQYIPTFYYKEAKKLLHELDPSDLSPSTKVGIRPQLVNWDTKELVMDFVVEETERSLHVLNAISPAFTSAPSFARYLVDRFVKDN